MIDKSFTIEDVVQKELIEKKSKFIATIIRVNSEEEAAQKIIEIKKKYIDARHNVFAYRIIDGSERFSDDGEPSGTAGVPILDILRGEKLKNVLLVVTRYFGGILLGTGGLVRAYSSVAKEVILASKKIEMKFCIEYELLVDYNYHNAINYYCKNNDVIIKKVTYSQNVCINVIFEKKDELRIVKELREITNRQIILKLIDTYYYA